MLSVFNYIIRSNSVHPEEKEESLSQRLLPQFLAKLHPDISEELPVGPGEGRLVHLDVEVRSEELLAPALLCHKEPA